MMPWMLGRGWPRRHRIAGGDALRAHQYGEGGKHQDAHGWISL
jgi:hypothetical protein